VTRDVAESLYICQSFGLVGKRVAKWPSGSYVISRTSHL
jgi:hypothetical protein